MFIRYLTEGRNSSFRRFFLLLSFLSVFLVLGSQKVEADTISGKTALVDQTTGPLYLEKGESIELSVDCMDAVSYQWYYSDNHNNRWIQCPDSGATSATIQLTYSDNRKERSYRCKIVDSAGITITSEPVLLRTREEDVINVCAYGAVGDGITDDTAALNAAFAAGVGKSVYLPAGTYLFSSTLKIPTECHVFGVGASSVLKLADQYSLDRVEWRDRSKACMVLLDESTSSSRLENFTLEGQTTGYDDDAIYGIAVMGRNHTVTNLNIHDINYFPDNWIGGTKGYGSVNAPGWGLAIYKAYNVSVYGGIYYNSGYENIGIEESQYILIDHVNSGVANRVPLQIHRNSAHIVMLDSYLHNNNNPLKKIEGGLIMHGTVDEQINDVLIKDCTIIGGHIYGVQGGENYITIQDCVVEKSIFTDGDYSSDHDWLITGCSVGGAINLHGTNMIVE